MLSDVQRNFIQCFHVNGMFYKLKNQHTPRLISRWNVLSILMRFNCWTYCQMFTGSLSSFFMSVGMIISLELSILLDVTRKGTRGLRLDFFCHQHYFYSLNTTTVASSPRLVTGGEDYRSKRIVFNQTFWLWTGSKKNRERERETAV